MMRCLAAAAAVLASASVSVCASAAPDPCGAPTAESADRCLRINHLQYLGTHNSYHLAPSPALYAAMESRRPGWGENIDYSHRPLTEQLELLNIRQFELDVFADPVGGRFARPLGRRLTGEPPLLEDPRMREPGFKVLHVQDLDYETVCPTLVSCLEEMRAWSDANPRHLPIMVLIEVKDSKPRDTLDLVFTAPHPVRSAELAALDAEILSTIGRDRMVTPDDVRGGDATLERSLAGRGWPTIAEARGRFLFALDNTGIHRDEYLRDRPNLEGRAMFVSTPPGESTAGFIKMNEVLDDSARIRGFVERGFLVRTRADIPVVEARTGDTRRRDAAMASGAQYVSTDYPEPSPFGSGYRVTLPGAEGRPARCNPVSAPAGCRDEWIGE